MEKTLGIIGGMGPLATVKLFEKIVLKTKAEKDQDHIHILIDNNTKIPSRPDFIFDHTKESPIDELISSAKKLESIGADYLVMPCNTAHYFYEDIKKETHIPFINMIEETLKHIKENYPLIRKVALLSTEATIDAGVYDKIFDSSNIKIIKPGQNQQSYINGLIKDVKQGKTEKDLEGFHELVEDMEGEGVEFFIAGCTEISVALDIYNIHGKFIDPLDILTKAIIDFSGKEINS